MSYYLILPLLVFLGTLVALLWIMLAQEDDLRDEIEDDLKGWWEYFNYDDDDDDDEDKTVNGDP